jgi:predicted nucleic acid-binding protein
MINAQIAAIALHHGMTTGTRNVKHFTPSGAPIVNPF